MLPLDLPLFPGFIPGTNASVTHSWESIVEISQEPRLGALLGRANRCRSFQLTLAAAWQRPGRGLRESRSLEGRLLLHLPEGIAGPCCPRVSSGLTAGSAVWILVFPKCTLAHHHLLSLFTANLEIHGLGRIHSSERYFSKYVKLKIFICVT